MIKLVLAVLLVGFVGGFGSRWYYDWKYRRAWKRAREAEYRAEKMEIIQKAVDDYENVRDQIKDMPRSERLRFMADRLD